MYKYTIQSQSNDFISKIKYTYVKRKMIISIIKSKLVELQH